MRQKIEQPIRRVVVEEFENGTVNITTTPSVRSWDPAWLETFGRIIGTTLLNMSQEEARRAETLRRYALQKQLAELECQAERACVKLNTNRLHGRNPLKPRRVKQ